MSHKGRKLKQIGTGITIGSKTGCVPPVNLRSKSASIIWMELKYFCKGVKGVSSLKDIQLFRYISYIPNNSYCGNAGGYYRTD